MTGPNQPRPFVVIELPRLDRSGGAPQYDETPQLRQSKRGAPSKLRRRDVAETNAAEAAPSRVRLLPGMSPTRRSQR
ncbi:MAG: hypothetical protein ABIY70_01005 [Capsulimonas sp.]|uniref:hypothetical protein n=1 Tax=Capsulimonas sp. TaxID=2494211 RepID=UPI0032634EC7